MLRNDVCRHCQLQQPLPVVDASCPHSSSPTMSSNLIIRASLVFLFVVGVAFLVASVADFDDVSRARSSAVDVATDGVVTSLSKDGWLLPRPELTSSAQRRNRRSNMANGSSVTTGAGPSSLGHVTVDEVIRSLSEWSDCSRVLAAMSNATYLTSGWTKAVYVGNEYKNDSESDQRGASKERSVAVKVVDVLGRDVRQCIRKLSPAGIKRSADDVTVAERRCQRLVERKLLKEAYILRLLENDHIIKLLGVCVPPSIDSVADVSNARGGTDDRSSFVTMVTELGTGVDVIRLLQMSWEERLKIIRDLTNLLHYVAHSDYGSIALNDFRRQQFVIVERPTDNAVDDDVMNVELKLVDVDDVTFDEVSCTVDEDCIEKLHDDVTIRVPCTRSRCEGLNEMKNVANAGRHFVTFLLAPGTPQTLRPLVNAIVDGYTGATLRIDELLRLVDKLVRSYSDGSYLRRETTSQIVETESLPVQYMAMAGSDLPGQHDYRCRYTIARSSCTVTVHDLIEAKQLCDFDPECRAFVLSNRTSWTGRKYAHLKNGVSSPSPSQDTVLYVRPL